MNKFEERYKEYDLIELLRILNQVENYQVEAVEAAKKELNSRNISEIEKEEAFKQIDIKKNSHPIKKIASAKFKEFNDIVISKKSSNKKLLKSLIISFLAITLGSLIIEWDFLYFMFFSQSAEWDFSVIISLFPITFLIVGSIGLLYRKSFGWNLLVLFSANSVVNNLIFFFNSIFYVNENDFFNSFIELPPSASYLIRLLIYGFALFGLTKQVIRRFYSVQKKTMYFMLGIGVGISLFFLIIL